MNGITSHLVRTIIGWGKVLAVFTTITAFIFLFLYVYIPTTEGYKTASGYVETRADILENVGAIKEIKFEPFGYSYSYGGRNTTSTLRLKITGEKAERSYVVELSKDSDHPWIPVSAVPLQN